MKLIFCMQIYKPFCKLILSILVKMASLAQSTRNNKVAKSLQYLEKEIKLIFAEINFRLFKKLVLSCLMGAARHAESTQNNNYAISRQCLKKAVSNEVDFLHADKHLNFLQVDTTFFIVFMYLARPVSSTQKNLYLSDISRTKLEMQFRMQETSKSSIS